MLDIAWPEVLVVGAVALIAIGPKDLPKVMFALGRWFGKARAFTHDMRLAFEQVSREAERANDTLSPSEEKKETSPPPSL